MRPRPTQPQQGPAHPHLPRLNLADQVLINTLAAILLPVVQDDGREKMLIAILAKVLAGANDAHPLMAPLVAAARALVTPHFPGSEIPPVAAAKMRAAGPVADFFIARAGAALDALQAAQKPEVANA